ALVDEDSFQEQGQLAGTPETDADGERVGMTPSNLVMGVARIGGRPCVVAGDDFTVGGGAYAEISLRKGLYADQLAIRRRVPLVRLLEAGGATVKGTAGRRGRSGYDFTAASPQSLLCLEAMASAPVVSAALGPVAGYPAARLVASHFAVMTRSNAQVLTGGPALVERALGVRISKDELGGAKVHARSGVVDNVADDEQDAFRQIRAFLSYLPTNVWEPAPTLGCDDPPGREEESLIELIPRSRRRAYKVRKAIEAVVDEALFFELGAQFGRSQVTGFARLAGQPVGLLANDCMYAGGAMTAESARKVRRFVETCDTFHLPIVSFVDEPGFMIGPDAERAATIRAGMEAMFAVLQTRVPWIAVLLRKAFGVAAGIHLGPNATVLAWPSAEAGSMPVESGVALAFRREIEAAPDPDAKRRELEDEIAAAQSIFPRAEEFGVHDLIDPRHTRPRLCQWIDEIKPQLRGLTGPVKYGPRP
ncbi:MAG: propionyl-CoA carboxylase, partial [Deltaproteobacteria bacterium]|nr:propionyl-CoA carboxylase [Deltaproteobacteria bacterium]